MQSSEKPPSTEEGIGLGILNYKESSDRSSPYILSITASAIKLPQGIDATKFAYTIPQHNEEDIKQISLLIQKSINDNTELLQLINDKKQINLTLTKDGNCLAEYKDEHGEKQNVSLLQSNSTAREVFKISQKQQEFVKLITVLKHSIKQDRMRRVVKKINPKKKNRIGKYNPTYIVYQRWTRMYERLNKLLADKTTSEKLSPAALKSLKFFLVQYLEHVARLQTWKAEEMHASLTPLNEGVPGYHRDYEKNNPILNLLNDNLKINLTSTSETLNIYDNFTMTVSDVEQFTKTIVTSLKGNLCLLSMDETDPTVLSSKILAALKEQSIGPVIFQFNIPPGTKQDGLIQFNSKVQEVINKNKLEYPRGKSVLILGTGTIADNHDFIWTQPYSDEFHLRRICAINGFTPSLQQAARIVSTEVSLDKLKSQLMHVTVPDLKEEEGLRTGSLIVEDLNGLLSSPTFKQFSKFTKNSYSSNYGLLGDNICRALEGLKQYPIDKTFNENGISILLKELYSQILSFMEALMSFDYKNDLKSKFYLADFTTLIFENINFMLEVSMDEKLAKTKLNSLLKEKVMSSSPIRPAVSGMVNSGVRNFPTIINACTASIQDEKKDTCNKPLGVLGFKDSYYEIVESMEKILHKSYIVSPPDYISSFKEQILLLRKNKQKLDLIFVDPQGSLQVDSDIVTSHNLFWIIDTAIQSGVTQKPLTVAMDLTIGKINDPYVVEILKKYQTQIESGDLNIVCFRSIQKFDQFGIDKISGGYIQVFSKNSAFINSLQWSLKKEEQDIDPINIKALAHLYENCAEGLDQYRDRSFENTNYIYNRIYKIFIQPDVMPNLPLTVLERKNVTNYFIGIRGVDYSNDAFTNALKKNDFLFDDRPSFGFSYTSLCGISATIDNSIVNRFTFGLEDKDKLDIFYRTLNEHLLSFAMVRDIDPRIEEALADTFPKLENKDTLKTILQNFSKDIIPNFSSYKELDNYYNTTFIQAIQASKISAKSMDDISQSLIENLLLTQRKDFNPVNLTLALSEKASKLAVSFSLFNPKETKSEVAAAVNTPTLATPSALSSTPSVNESKKMTHGGKS